MKKDNLKNFENFTGKHLCRSLLLIKLQANTYLGELLRTAASNIMSNLYQKSQEKVVK